MEKISHHVHSRGHAETGRSALTGLKGFHVPKWSLNPVYSPNSPRVFVISLTASRVPGGREIWSPFAAAIEYSS